MSLRRRVLLGCAAVVLVLLVADAALAATFRGFLLGQVDDELRASADGLLRFAAGPDRPMPRGPAGRRGPLTGRTGPLSDFYVGLAADDGRLLGRLDAPLREDRGAPAPDAGEIRAHTTEPGAPLEPFTVGAVDDDGWRLVALRAGAGGEVVLVGASLEGVGATYQRMLAVLMIATLVVVAMLVAAAWWVLRQGVRPLAAMTSTAEAIADGALHARVDDTDVHTEAGRLGTALNTMLARIEAAFGERAASETRLRQFVADASHELRTPLTSIRGYTELYRAGGLADPEQLQGAMRRVEQEATRMGVLVDDLLLLAKLDQGRPLERRPVDLAGLTGDMVADLRAVDPDRPVIFRSQPATVTGDGARLRQAVGNLLANVRVHTPPGRPVTVTVGTAGGDAFVEIADTGAGMAAEVAERAFERFYRADVARARQGGPSGGGSGLGLAIVAGIARAHGGRVGVTSVEGQGSTFRLVLPVAPPPGARAAQR